MSTKIHINTPKQVCFFPSLLTESLLRADTTGISTVGKEPDVHNFTEGYRFSILPTVFFFWYGCEQPGVSETLENNFRIVSLFVI